MPKKPKIKAETPIPRSATLISDPVYRLISKGSTPTIWTIILIIHLAVYIAVGLMIDSRYPNVPNILRIRDSAEIINGINVWVIFVPTIWAYYRWLPENVFSMIREMETAGIIKVPSNSHETLSGLLGMNINSKWIHVIAIASTTLSFFYLLMVVIPTQEETLNGLIDFWYYTTGSKFFFFLLYLLANYITFVFVLRVLVTVASVNRFFQIQNAVARLYPLHPDKCGGMGNLGNLISKITLIVVLVPIWITIFSLYTLIAGGESQFITTLIVYIVYLLLLPLVLVLPLWQPHKAMVRYKNDLLVGISKELLDIEVRLTEGGNNRDRRKMKNQLEYYKQIQEIYNTLEKNIPTWPISISVLRSFGAVASSPVILGLLSNVLIEYVKNLFI